MLLLNAYVRRGTIILAPTRLQVPESSAKKPEGSSPGTYETGHIWPSSFVAPLNIHVMTLLRCMNCHMALYVFDES